MARGTERFRRGNYDGAIADFYAAYERQQVPTLLFNIAQAHRKSGRGQDALTVFEQFKLADPKSSLLPEVDAYIAELKAKQEAERTIAERDRALSSWLASLEQRARRPRHWPRPWKRSDCAASYGDDRWRRRRHRLCTSRGGSGAHRGWGRRGDSDHDAGRGIRPAAPEPATDLAPRRVLF